MRGSIVKKSKKYYIVLSFYDESGKRKQKWISGFDKKAEAVKELPRYVQEIHDGFYINLDNITLEKYLEAYKSDYVSPNLSKNSYEKLITAANKINPHIGKIKLHKIKPLHIQSMVNEWNKEQQMKPGTIQTYMRVLSSAMQQAIKWQLITYNPCKAVTGPRIEHNSLSILTGDQIQILLAASKETPIYPVIMLALMTGMRRGEILGLQWHNVDLANGRIFVEHNLVKAGNDIILKDTKTSSGKRSVDISIKLTHFLKMLSIQQKENALRFGKDYTHNTYVCKYPDGTIFRPDYVPKKFKKILTEASLPQLRFHDLRHTHASMLLLAGENPKVIQERLGHSSIKITLDTYSHLVPSMQKSAADRMESMVDF